MEDFEVAEKTNSEVEDIDIYGEPVSSLKEVLSLKELKKGAIFEVDHEADDPGSQEKKYFNDEELMKVLNYEDTGLGDDGDDELEPFEGLRKKMTTIAEGVFKRVKVKGHGMLVPDKAFVTMHYNNYLEYNDEPFDSSRLRNIPFKFTLNTGAVIVGLDIGVATMQTGEVAQFLISPQSAFGKLGIPPRIPANATILCEVELINFMDGADLVDMNEMSIEEKKEANFQKKLNACKTKHKIGNKLFQERQYHKSLAQYRWALKTLENTSLANEDEEKQQQQLLLKLHLNSSLCNLMLSTTRHAKIHAQRVLDIDPENTKAHFRLGKALRMEGECQGARKHLRKALHKEPSNEEINLELAKVDKMEKLNQDIERSMCRKMFAQTEPVVPKRNETPKDTQAFRDDLRKNLPNFIEKDEKIEFNTCSFSLPEINCIKEIANELDLDVQDDNRGTESVLIVRKKC